MIIVVVLGVWHCSTHGGMGHKCDAPPSVHHPTTTTMTSTRGSMLVPLKFCLHVPIPTRVNPARGFCGCELPKDCHAFDTWCRAKPSMNLCFLMLIRFDTVVWIVQGHSVFPKQSNNYSLSELAWLAHSIMCSPKQGGEYSKSGLG